MSETQSLSVIPMTQPSTARYVRDPVTLYFFGIQCIGISVLAMTQLSTAHYVRDILSLYNGNDIT